MPKKERGHASFAHSPSKYTVAVNLQDAERPHRVNATVTDTRVNVYGQHVDEIKTKDGDVRYNFHGFSNEFQLPDDVDPDSLTLSMADNQTILIEGNKRDRRGRRQRASSEQRARSQAKPQTPAKSAKSAHQKDGRNGETTDGRNGETTEGLIPWKVMKDEDVQAAKKNQGNGMVNPCEPDSNWVKLKYTSPPRTPCCPLCCGPV